jgi:lysozyme family protein
MRQTLKKALVINFGHEGGYVNAKTDRGGPTKYGITIGTLSRFYGRQATVDEVKNLTLAVAEEIYRRFYWPMAGCDQLPAGLDYAMFNTAVMSGPSRGVKILQIVLQAYGLYNEKIDGHFGPATMNGVTKWSEGVPALITAFVLRHLEFCRQIKGKQGWASNGRGWEYRLTGVDPKGVFKRQPGVIGFGIQIYDEYVRQVADFPNTQKTPSTPMEQPEELAPQMEAPAIPSKPTATDAISKPESLSAIAALITTIISATADSPPLQYGLAGVVVIMGATAAYYFYRRIRSEEVI